MEALTCAVVAWKVRHAANYSEWLRHVSEHLERAVEAKADLIVFPECIDLERLDSGDSVSTLCDLNQDWMRGLGNDATRTGLIIVAGSVVLKNANQMTNCSVTFWPDGRLTSVEKHVLTQYELHEWGLSAGEALSVGDGIGTTICYDSEFPASGRALAEAGAWIQAVPAFTETAHGFHRVRYACHARAVENQIFVLHASLVGGLGYEPVPGAYGSSAVLAPPCEPFPANGVLAETQTGEEGIAVCLLDKSQLIAARGTGDVRNWEDRDRATWTVSDPTFRHP